ncbi:PilZ domain-containing protein [Geothermobacter ehrlichii]|uniref:PilZ domain-containing protein n=1 Tax=Geothermobacter ehrlichii TaxID=213224 RepID=A0A5D3WNI7_9BACT|nr:PilZ domain-containing protein [Geothermobacter ehrlichii]TYP00118.1 PilZ domain-containing protein [Geothermobacter ehrlichii]
MADNRTQPRHRKRIQVRYGVEHPSRIAFTEDVSDEGFFIRSALVQKPGTILQVEMITPEGEVVLLEGRIRWAKKVPPNLLARVKGGMGIKIRSFHQGEEAYRRLCQTLRERLA